MTVDEAVSSIFYDSDEDVMREVDDPDEPIMDGSDDDFDDLHDQLEEEMCEGANTSLHSCIHAHPASCPSILSP